jgi:hypothetical protein
MNNKFLFTALLSLSLLACSSEKTDAVPSDENTESVSDTTALNDTRQLPVSSSENEDLNVKTTVELPNIFSVLRSIL